MVQSKFLKIALDAGHGVSRDGGAEGIQREEAMIDAVMLPLKKRLLQMNVICIEVRPESASSVKDSLDKRTDKANAQRCDLYLSLHFNKYNGSASGTEVFAASSAGWKIAQRIVNNIAKLGFKNRGVKDGKHLAVLRQTLMPAVLVEGCFCDSQEDVALFDPEKMADAIATGLLNRQLPATNLNLKLTTETWLKTSTAQSSTLPDEDKQRVYPSKLPIESWKEADGNHVLVELKVPLRGRTEWFAFADHCEIEENGKPLILSPRDDAPILDRDAIEIPAQPADRGKRIIVLGRELYANEPIAAGTFYVDGLEVKGGHFTWAEFLHGGERIPQNEQHFINLIALAKRAEWTRTKLGGLPMLVTSAFRPDPWNRQAGGSSLSTHKDGRAIDFTTERPSRQNWRILDPIFPGGLGIYSRFPQMAHIDIRPYRARW
ncbi:N-acetylmuramoyl-L-alanine amidase [Lusitaniella coriacea LEGE 07157]|uniref:N-acetylmuramoyl-L-alanine amidase n=1 Tax=Lusitaniella coriacea LEGE 07157 TaxID=945747 RepID=A0A8J7E0D0_9CYAN|nr:N-acetylmuramoyl-L-alanine amidase [Lusitaniella coriacea]MBE9119064.1 N-acetylmuramoyl-L-alanine amidase [Lusitaniella coriacea LEGE 07157]